jgi:hypothetical protein
MPDEHAKPGPLKLPPSQNPETARAARRLRGHSTSDLWLPEGLWPELDDLRAEIGVTRRNATTLGRRGIDQSVQERDACRR